MDPGAGAISLLHSDEDAEFSAFDCTADGNSAFLGDKNGFVRMCDLRAPEGANSEVELHQKKINTLQVRGEC